MDELLCPVLIGRDDEFALLLDLLAAAAAGRGSTAVVVGEAGAGKSRLALELSRAAAAPPMQTWLVTGRRRDES